MTFIFRSSKIALQLTGSVCKKQQAVPSRSWIHGTTFINHHDEGIREERTSSPSWSTALSKSRRALSNNAGDDTITITAAATDGKHVHAAFEEQLQELEAERKELFGGESDAHDNNDNSNDPIASMMRMNQTTVTETTTNEYQDEMEEMKEEREALFGFTDQDRNAWTNVSVEPKDDDESGMPPLSQLVAEARRQQQEQEQHDSDYVQTSDDVSMGGAAQAPVDDDKSSRRHGLTHVSSDGTSVAMVDVGNKSVTRRTATAQSIVRFPEQVWNEIHVVNSSDDTSSTSSSSASLMGRKGPILSTAELAGIMGAKQTSNLIPLCHPLPLEKVSVSFELDSSTRSVIIQCTAKCSGKTGVEMEALVGANVAALTIYDMVKALSHDIQIIETKLLHKAGGKSGDYNDSNSN